MRISDNWQEYCLIDTADGQRLERWGDVTLIRPDPQIIWKGEGEAPEWKTAHAKYNRSSSGGGSWDFRRKLPESWQIHYRDLTFMVKPTGFKHTGLFPEQAVNWDYCMNEIRSANRPINVLNLFAYTGGATLACASAGASVGSVAGVSVWVPQAASERTMTRARMRASAFFIGFLPPKNDPLYGGFILYIIVALLGKCNRTTAYFRSVLCSLSLYGKQISFTRLYNALRRFTM